ncbi:hypothetical protein BACCIP111899_02669 [Bacillus rhizoplanae]|uniref:Uncharacterized protein n=1 Tax=Bacillus rhizoplanae TaxID=2880966 RepID=A0ABM8YCI2_9BACI|nr:hypothetical protein [Bacillus rhizoplanae]CAG9613454.1 hypothetical protein BACCIP111899_02669 [Bacillus rhizoplanae]
MKDYYLVKLNHLFVNDAALEDMHNPFDVIELTGAKQFAHKFESEQSAGNVTRKINGQVIMVKVTVQEEETYLN